MPEPIEFGTKRELVECLQRKANDILAHFAKPEPNLVRLIKESVGSNTFRAFHLGKRHKPSRVFREWAYRRMAEEKTIDDLRRRLRKSDFDKVFHSLADDLRRVWQRETKHQLPFGQSRKLVGLLLKGVIRWSGFNRQTKRRLLRLLHVPLDTYSLAAIRQPIKEIKNKEINYNGVPLNIPRGATMGFIDDDRKKYAQIQTGIRLIAKEAQVPPIYIDVVAWNLSH